MTKSTPIRIVIVDDSRVMREYFEFTFGEIPDVEVVGVAENGAIGLEMIKALAPDAVLSDVEMPEMDGFELTRAIMAECPRPVILVTASWSAREVSKSFAALEAGAITIVEKPCGIDDPVSQRIIADLVRIVKAVTGRGRHKPPSSDAGEKTVAIHPRRSPIYPRTLFAIGASTGGPEAIRRLLVRLPRPFPAPILVVQHISGCFMGGMVRWLTTVTGHTIQIPVHREELIPGRVYLAPDGVHMGISKTGHIELSDGPPEHYSRPSVSYLFRSIAKNCPMESATALLTGMGRDGALELKELRQAGGLTCAQNKETCVVHGMPGEAIRVGGVDFSGSPEEIAEHFIRARTSSDGTDQGTAWSDRIRRGAK